MVTTCRVVTVDQILVASLADSARQTRDEARVHTALRTLQEWPAPGTASLVGIGAEGEAVVVGVLPDRPFVVVVLSPAPAPDPDVLNEALTKREREVAELAGARLDNATIARVLRISPDTVQSHMKKITRKYGGRDWHRSRARTDNVAQPAQRLTHAERTLLSRIAVSPLVGALASHAGISPRQCRARLDSIARKVQGPETAQQPRCRTRRAGT